MAASLSCAILALALVSFSPALSQLKATGNGERSFEVDSSLVPSESSASYLTLMGQQIKFVYVSTNGNAIVLDTLSSKITFPKVQAASGSHGSGYLSVKIVASESGTSLNVVAFNSDLSAVTTAVTLGANAEGTYPISSSYSAQISLQCAQQTSFRSVKVSYGCSL